MVRGLSLREHINRVDQVVSRVAGSLPEAAPTAVQTWNAEKQDLTRQGYLEGGADIPGEVVERFLDLVAEGKCPNAEDGRAQSLAWALDAPAGALRSVHKGFLVAENTVEQLLGYVTHFLGDTEMPAGSLEEVQQTGLAFNGPRKPLCESWRLLPMTDKLERLEDLSKQIPEARQRQALGDALDTAVREARGAANAITRLEQLSRFVPLVRSQLTSTEREQLRRWILFLQAIGKRFAEATDTGGGRFKKGPHSGRYPSGRADQQRMEGQD